MPPIKKTGSSHAGGAKALSFKKGTKNYTETETRPVSTDRLAWASDRKKISPSQQTRSSGESMTDFKIRRDKNRASLKK